MQEATLVSTISKNYGAAPYQVVNNLVEDVAVFENEQTTQG